MDDRDEQDGAAADALARHTDYGDGALRRRDLDDDPFAQLRRWLGDAEEHGVPEPNAMVLSTVDPDGAPSSRTVLLRGVDDELMFVTRHDSRKGVALAHESRVSLLLAWYGMRRQVIVDGVARRAPDRVSDDYFSSRPRGSQIGAWASEQSRPIADRDALESRYAEAEARFGDGTVPRPEQWGAYLVEVRRMEFWRGRSSRLHDRLRFTAEGAGWSVERLQP